MEGRGLIGANCKVGVIDAGLNTVCRLLGGR